MIYYRNVLSIPIVGLLLCRWVAEGANILYIIPFTSTSHYMMLKPIGLELARRGHNVTVITAHAEKEPPKNYHQVMADDIKIWESVDGGRPNVFTMVDQSFEEFYRIILWNGGLATTENALNSTKVQEFMSKDNSFDLVISELFFQESMYMFSHIYKAPLVLVTTYGNCMRNNLVLRNPLQLSTVIQEFGMIRHPLTFFGRLTNLYYSFYEYFWWKVWFLPLHEELVKKYFKNLPEPVPTLEELHRNVSVVLINSHFSVDTSAAYLPNIVEVGGLHLQESENKLPKDLQAFLDGAVDGVVYVNFGSNVQSSELPPEKRRAFLNVFGRLKQKVLWKWEDPMLEGKPSNVEIRNWMPQKEILAHPNIRVFIAHGGLIGFQEATFHGVPVLGIPIYADQYNNLLQAEENGYGKILEYHNINEKTLEEALRTMLENESYKNKASEMSVRFKDRPLSGLETGIFWIEYVIRHNGADFLKSPALKMSWLAQSMVDIFVFLAAVLLLTIIICIKCLKLFSRASGTNKQKKTDINKKKR